MADLLRGRVVDVTASGIIVEVPSVSPGYVTPPIQRLAAADVSAGDRVLLARVGRYIDDLAVVGVLTSTPPAPADVAVHVHPQP